MSDSQFITDPRTLTLLSIWNSYRTALQLVTLRGYKIKKENFAKFESFKKSCEKFDEFQIREKLAIFGTNDDNSNILVLWEKYKITPDSIGKHVDMFDKHKIDVGIIISPYITTGNSIKSCVDNLKKRSSGKDDILNISLTLFYESELQFNIFSHVCVPKYEIISKEEKENLLALYSTTPEKLPKIKMTNIICRLLGLQKGIVLKIIEDSLILKGDKRITYRIVS
jgi:DNA-directed RNA polymerase subunit H (RpoH/RPB5)